MLGTPRQKACPADCANLPASAEFVNTSVLFLGSRWRQIRWTVATNRIVFNCSLPRSGSSLLQNILAQNPDFYCSPTSGLFELLVGCRAQFSTLDQFKAQNADEMKSAFAGFCRGAIEGFYRGITEKPVCIDKSRGWLHYYTWLDSFYPSPKLLVCVRDLRAILSSMEKLFQKNRHLNDSADNQLQMNMITKQNRVISWLNTVPLGITLKRLLDAMELGTIRHAHVIRFEDLTARPKAVMQKVYEYLDFPYFEHDFENVLQITQEDDSFYPIYGDHKIRSKVAPVPIDYLQTLGKEVCQGVMADNVAFYKAFYPDAK